MNLFTLSIAYIRSRLVARLLLVLLLAAGVALVLLLMLADENLNQRLHKDAQGIDLVVGAKGSPLQLILSSIYQMDIPNGNIALSDAQQLMKNPKVKLAIPLALGDSYHSFRIVGTTPDYITHYGAHFVTGGVYNAPLEAVAGAATKLALGNVFAGSHGLVAGGEVHAQFPYKVVGVLAPTGTVIDRLILTPVETVWKIHVEHHDEDDTEYAQKEVTALLIQYRSPNAAMSLPREINRSTAMQAASPAFEIARLMSLIGIGADTLTAFGIALVVAAMIGMLAALYQAVEERQYDMAMMRVLGGSPGQIIRQLLLETALLLGLGIVLGFVLSRIGFVLLSLNQPLLTLSWTILPSEIGFIAALFVIGLGVSLIPAWRVYRLSISGILARG